MRILKKIFKVLKAIVYLPINLYDLSKRSEDFFRIEKKLDLFSQKLDNLELDSISKSLEEIIKYQAKKSNLESSHEKSIGLDLSSVITSLEKKFENQFLQFESLLSIYYSLPNLKFLPATRGWAGSPDFLAKIIEVILKEKPRLVLEASSGVSSVIIGLALKLNNQGKAISLDHDSFYEKITNENLEVNGIGNFLIVKHCPFNDYEVNGQFWKWYNIDDLNLTEKIDLLIIDGPPRTTQKLARYPALPILYKYFSDNVIILLDDAKRPDEILIVKKWIEFLTGKGDKINIEHHFNYEKGLVLLNVKKEI